MFINIKINMEMNANGMDAREKIIKIFNDNVKGKKPNLESYVQKHHGKEGHWLETMSRSANS